MQGKYANGAICSFRTLWNSTAKDRYKWEDNPYVFVYEFEFPNRIGITVRITSKGQSQLTDKILNDLKPK